MRHVSILAGLLACCLVAARAEPAQVGPPRWSAHHAPAPAGQQDGIVLPILDGTWWKLKVSAKGFAVNPDDGSTQPATFKITAYMQLSVVADGTPGSEAPLYNYAMWTETDPDTWSNLYGDTIWVAGLDKNGNEALIADTFMGFDIGTAGVASIYSGRLNIHLDKNGLLKSASFKTLAGAVTESELSAGTDFYGSMKITGTMIDPDKLPFLL